MIDLTVYGDPAALRTAADAGRLAAGELEQCSASVRRADCGSWTGAAGDAYRTDMHDTSTALTALADRIEPACRALDDLAGTIAAVKAELASARDVAAAAGLAVSAEAVQPPAAADGAATPEQSTAYDKQVTAYNEAVRIADGARSKERDGQTRAVDAMNQSSGDGLVENILEKLGLVPPDGMDGITGAGYLFGLGGLAFGGAADWMSKGVLGMWQPKFKNASGRWVWGTNRGWSAMDRLRLSMRPGAASRDWKPLPHKAATLRRWETAGKWVGRAGGVATALTSGWEQWNADADDPSLDTGERADRAATKGAATGIGAYGGASAGMSIGGVIGTAIFPGPGTVIGGAVGGLVGGAIGGFAGSELGDVVNDKFDGAVHAAGDGLSKAADKLSFWD